ncbi:hypothetical protein AAC387_Pa04g1484 [Persea americana]
MLFYLTTLNLARFLHEDAPSLKEDETDKQVVAAVDAWKHADFLCRNYILNGLDNTLYTVSKIPDMHLNTIIESRNASFFEHVFHSNSSQESSSLKRTHDTTNSNNRDQQGIDGPRRSERART